MENTQTYSTPFNRFAIPVRWGIIITLFYMIASGVVNMFMINSLAYTFMWPLIYLAIFTMYCIGGRQQRKAMGGYISFKDAFQAIFVMILISTPICELWDIVYVKYIDPDFITKLKESVEMSMLWMKAPESAIEERITDLDAGYNLSIGQRIFGWCTKVIVLSIFGFICSAIVKKNKPEVGA